MVRGMMGSDYEKETETERERENANENKNGVYLRSSRILNGALPVNRCNQVNGHSRFG